MLIYKTEAKTISIRHINMDKSAMSIKKMNKLFKNKEKCHFDSLLLWIFARMHN